MKLSIIVPVYNEEKTIEEILRRVIAIDLGRVSKEIVVVDDGSSDSSREKIKNIQRKNKNVKLIEKTNGGKGTAVKMGINIATGDYVLIQDADLEYNPKDVPNMLSKIQHSKDTVVYGTRLKRWPNFKRDERTLRFIMHYLGNKFLSLVTSILYGQWITDMETCYKLFPKEAVKKFDIHSKSFELEPEITAKILKNKYKIIEVPITTNPRGYKEGKKLNMFHAGPLALWTLFKYRIVN